MLISIVRKEHEPLWNIANNKYNKFKNEAAKALQIENLEEIEKVKR